MKHDAEEKSLKDIDDVAQKVAQARGRFLAPDKDLKGAPKKRSAILLVSDLLAELLGPLIVGCFVGWALDRWLNTKPWFFFVFLFLSLAAGVFQIFKRARKWGLSQEKDRGIH